MVSAARCNAQYPFKTTRLKTFGSHLVYTSLKCFEMYMSLADSMRSLFWREENCDVIASATDMFIVYHVTMKEASR